mgnify:CR=1 FL=1
MGLGCRIQADMKREWDRCILTRLWWNGPEPVPGDGLRTKSGRLYLIMDVRGKRLECLVLPKSEPIEGTVFEWTWGARTRKAK